MKLQVGFVLLNFALFLFLDYLSFLTVIFSAVFFLHLRSVLLLNLLSYAQHKPMCLCILGS